MAEPNSKTTLKDYCLRNLGFGVIDINVSDDQIDDRIDEAVQYFAHYYYDNIEKMYLKYKITTDDITRFKANATTTATDRSDSSLSFSFLEGKNFISMPSSVVSVLRIFSFDNAATNNMFDIRYQLRLNDLYDFSSTSIIHYEMTMQHLDYLSHLLVGETPIRFYEHQGRLYLDMNVDGDIIVTTTDPSTNTGGSIAARQVVLTNPLTGQSATLDASSTGGVSRARVFFANM